MVLSKNEQIALMIVAVLVVAVAGLFVFVLPAYNRIAPNRASYNEIRNQYNTFEENYGDSAFQRIGQDIVVAYEYGVGASEGFYENEMYDFEADRRVREILDSLNLSTGDLAIQRLQTQALTLTQFMPFNISYPIKDLATIGEVGDVAPAGEAEENDGESEGAIEGENVSLPPPPAEAGTSVEGMRRVMQGAIGNRAFALRTFREWLASDEHDNADVIEAMRSFLANDAEVVVAQRVVFEIPLNVAQKDALSMYIYNLPNATYIRSIRRGDVVAVVAGAVEVEGELDTGEVVDADGQGEDGGDAVLPVPAGGLTFMYTVELDFYIVEPMNEPSDEGFQFLTFER
ncbi:MAG: hypothetical protein FWF76_06985 [Oscillospiraceae bacterium]|nr:hypothetical protein [Oscillospiraceae bacterium]